MAVPIECQLLVAFQEMQTNTSSTLGSWTLVWQQQQHYKGLQSPRFLQCWWDCSLTPAQKWPINPTAASAAQGSGNHGLWEMSFLSLLPWPQWQWYCPIVYKSLSNTSFSTLHFLCVQYLKWWFLFHWIITDWSYVDSINLSFYFFLRF